MKRNQQVSILITTACLSLTTWCATNALASVTLTNVPLDPSGSYTDNQARAVTPDGKYVVGFSGTSATTSQNGYFYDIVTNLLVVYPKIYDSGDYAYDITGVAYRTLSGEGTNEVVVSALDAGWHAEYMTKNGGVSWSNKKRRDANVAQATALPAANGLAATGTDVLYTTFLAIDTHVSPYLYTNFVVRMSNTWPASALRDKDPNAGATTTGMNGISASGRAVGWQTDTRVNYVLDWTGTNTAVAWYFNGLDGTTAGEAFAVSTNGRTIFGRSPVTNPASRPGNWPYKATFDATLPGPATQLSINELPSFPDAAGSGSLGAPFGCTADGKYAVGMSYRGVERAVLWDTSAPNPLNWQVVELTELARASGNMDIFASLDRGYSIGVKAAGDLVIVGVGTDTNTFTRAFIMTVSPPIPPIGYPPIVTISGSYPAGCSFSFLSVTGALPTAATISNFLVFTTNVADALSTWTVITGEQSTGGTMTLTDPNPPDAQRFYRILIQ